MYKLYMFPSFRRTYIAKCSSKDDFFKAILFKCIALGRPCCNRPGVGYFQDPNELSDPNFLLRGSKFQSQQFVVNFQLSEKLRNVSLNINIKMATKTGLSWIKKL